MGLRRAHLLLALALIGQAFAGRYRRSGTEPESVEDSQSCENVECFLGGVNENTSFPRLRFLLLDEPVLAEFNAPLVQLIGQVSGGLQLSEAELTQRLTAFRDGFLTTIQQECDIDVNRRQVDFINAAFIGTEVRDGFTSLLTFLIQVTQGVTAFPT